MSSSAFVRDTPSSRQGPRPLQLANSFISTTGNNPIPSSPLSRSNSTNSNHSRRPVPKRLSSISYSHSATNALGFSPVSPAIRSAPLQRDESSNKVQFRVDTGKLDDSKPPPVLTLAEKHADLLQFIAQKESKCLELRSQLEQHETELRALKSKWEKIVSKSKPKSDGNAIPITTSVGGDVVGVIREVGRYLGGLTAEEPQPGYLLQRDGMSPSSSSSPSPSLSAAPLVTESPAPSTSKLMTPVTTPNRIHKRDVVSQRSSASSSSSIQTSGETSIRDSMSSVSTAVSSLGISSPRLPARDMTSTSAAQERVSLDESLLSNHDSSVDLGLWVSSGLNKKWEQVQKTQNFSRHSNRASLLLSDVSGMSNSILGSLSSALLQPPPSKPPTIGRAQTISTGATMTRKATKNASPQKSVSPISLLDEDEGENTLASLDKPIVPRPSPQLKTVPTLLSTTPSKWANRQTEEPEEEWNW